MSAQTVKDFFLKQNKSLKLAYTPDLLFKVSKGYCDNNVLLSLREDEIRRVLPLAKLLDKREDVKLEA